MEPLNFMGTGVWNNRPAFRYRLYRGVSHISMRFNSPFFDTWSFVLHSHLGGQGIIGLELQRTVGPL